MHHPARVTTLRLVGRSESGEIPAQWNQLALVAAESHYHTTHLDTKAKDAEKMPRK